MDDLDLLAAEFVLGTLDSESRGDVAARARREAGLKAAVEKWERRLPALDGAVPSVEVSPGLWDRISEAVDSAPHPGHEIFTVRASEGEWVNRGPGIDRKTLFLDREVGFGSYLFRIAPGAVLREHSHRKVEDCMVLEGDVSFADTHLRAGDFHIAFPGAVHADITSRGGALLYVRGAIS